MHKHTLSLLSLVSLMHTFYPLCIPLSLMHTFIPYVYLYPLCILLSLMHTFIPYVYILSLLSLWALQSTCAMPTLDGCAAKLQRGKHTHPTIPEEEFHIDKGKRAFKPSQGTGDRARVTFTRYRNLLSGALQVLRSKNLLGQLL